MSDLVVDPEDRFSRVAAQNAVVRALDFYPGDLGSNQIRDVGFFQRMHHFLFTKFHVRKTTAHIKTR